jgi:hypothetical protein
MTNGARVTLDSQDALIKRLGVPSLGDVTPDQFPEIITLIPEMSDELRKIVLELVPGFEAYALEAMKAVKDTLATTTAAIGKEQTELNESFGHLQQILAGRLARDETSEQHAEFIIHKLVELQKLKTEQSTETNKLIAEQADATRLTMLTEAAIPVLTTILAMGVQILINRRGAGGFKI